MKLFQFDNFPVLVKKHDKDSYIISKFSWKFKKKMSESNSEKF